MILIVLYKYIYEFIVIMIITIPFFRGWPAPLQAVPWWLFKQPPPPRCSAASLCRDRRHFCVCTFEANLSPFLCLKPACRRRLLRRSLLCPYELLEWGAAGFKPSTPSAAMGVASFIESIKLMCLSAGMGGGGLRGAAPSTPSPAMAESRSRRTACVCSLRLGQGAAGSLRLGQGAAECESRAEYGSRARARAPRGPSIIPPARAGLPGCGGRAV